ncbi:FMN-linked oxidoreductase [Amylocystis lapponica]|nr:FMN-linked oxidoreductase [Amylocystis lapponica]
MVNQSDLPFRILVRRYGTTLVYTQMLLPTRLLNDQEYLEYHLRELGDPCDRPVVVQLGGNDPETVVRAARTVQGSCDAIDLNLGCPQEAARDAHYGAYLLGQKDWPLVESIVSAMSHSLTVPCPASATLKFSQRLESAGSSWITLHARHVSARRRRQGPADLEQIRTLKQNLTVPVVSNGNVRVWEDIQNNRAFTGADGIMHLCNILPDPVQISLEYLDICREHPGTVTIQIVQMHVRHFVDHQCGRRPWFHKFRAALSNCPTLTDIDILLRVKVQRWRGLYPPESDIDDKAEHMEDPLALLSLDG